MIEHILSSGAITLIVNHKRDFIFACITYSKCVFFVDVPYLRHRILDGFSVLILIVDDNRSRLLGAAGVEMDDLIVVGILSVYSVRGTCLIVRTTITVGVIEPPAIGYEIFPHVGESRHCYCVIQLRYINISMTFLLTLLSNSCMVLGTVANLDIGELFFVFNVAVTLLRTEGLPHLRGVIRGQRLLISNQAGNDIPILLLIGSMELRTVKCAQIHSNRSAIFDIVGYQGAYVIVLCISGIRIVDPFTAALSVHQFCIDPLNDISILCGKSDVFAVVIGVLVGDVVSRRIKAGLCAAAVGDGGDPQPVADARL